MAGNALGCPTCYAYGVKRWYLSAGFVVGIAVLMAVLGSYCAEQRTRMTYVDAASRFSLNLAPDVVVQDLPSDNGVETLTAERGADEYVQITITAWPQGEVLNPGALAHEYSALATNTVEPTTIDGVSGIAFADSTTGASEVWFASKGFLYQLVEWGNSDALLGRVISGWKIY